jgi:hypothetical protein
MLLLYLSWQFIFPASSCPYPPASQDPLEFTSLIEYKSLARRCINCGADPRLLVDRADGPIVSGPRTEHAAIQIRGINTDHGVLGVRSSQTAMLLLFVVHLLSARALPVPVIDESSPPSSCKDYDNCRSLLSIIWSCITTIFLCTWVAVHPNVPEPVHPNVLEPVDAKEMSFWRKRARQLSRFIRNKVVMFICALLVPEYILAWAIRQFLVASRIAKENGMCK